jgi:hypothetical protein
MKEFIKKFVSVSKTDNECYFTIKTPSFVVLAVGIAIYYMFK